MNDDIVCLLQDLGRDLAVDVIANFIIRNPETEDLVAARMGALLSSGPTQTPATGASTSALNETPRTNPIASFVSSLIPEALSFGSYKMIFVVNMELNMGRGKQCAQVAHAAIGLCLQIQESGNDGQLSKLYQWLTTGQKKIVVRGNNLEHIKQLQNEANKASLPYHLVADAGCTQIAPGSKTVLAIFGTNDELETITGSLKLL